MVVGLELLPPQMNVEVLVVLVTLHVPLIATALVTVVILVTISIAVLLGYVILALDKKTNLSVSQIRVLSGVLASTTISYDEHNLSYLTRELLHSFHSREHHSPAN